MGRSTKRVWQIDGADFCARGLIALVTFTRRNILRCVSLKKNSLLTQQIVSFSIKISSTELFNQLSRILSLFKIFDIFGLSTKCRFLRSVLRKYAVTTGLKLSRLNFFICMHNARLKIHSIFKTFLFYEPFSVR